MRYIPFCLELPPHREDLKCDNCGDCRKDVDIPVKEKIMGTEQPQEELQGMAKLQALPVVDRLIVMLNMLENLQRKNIQLSGRTPLTKQIEIECAEHRAKAQAYRDTTAFITKFFEPELRDKLLPVMEEPSLIQVVTQ